MRAVRFSEFGDPSVLRVDQVPDARRPVADELLIRVAASSVNGTDLGLRRGDLKIATWGRMPFVPGFDVAGEVLQCGPAVTAFHPGDQVTALLSHAGGGQAEQVVLRQHRAALAPRTCSLTAAATLPLAGLTALQALYGHARLPARRMPARVLVIGAAGGIGSFTVQLAKLAGAHVTGVASGPKLGFVAGLGADEVVDYRSQDVAGSGERWDVIVDSPCKARYRKLRDVLTEDGVLVSTRPLSPDAFRAVLRGRNSGGGRRFAAVRTQARSQDLARLARLVDSGRLRAAPDRVYSVERVVEAHMHAEHAVTGKVVLELLAP